MLGELAKGRGPVIGELQRLVDALASQLNRAVVLEDRRQRLIAYSQHDQPIDTVRRETILQRRTTPEVIAWLRRFGITESAEAVRIDGNPDLELLPRVCIPLRHSNLLLGFLWFIDADRSMSDEDIALATHMGGDFALALYRENLVEELSQRREEEALRNLLVPDADARAHAARELVDAGAFVGDTPVAALVVQPLREDEAAAEPELLRLAIEQALVQARRKAVPREVLHLVRFDHGLLLAAADGATVPVTGHGQALVKATERALAGLPGYRAAVVGVGEPQPSLADIATSYEQARQAARVAASLPGVGPLAEWRELGVYRALAQLSADQVGSSLLHPGLPALLGAGDEQVLARTLETYLDLAGNAQATASTLQLHRASLYYRLQRIEEVARADLKDGSDRLALHLGLKLARLNGRYAP
jgi:DNA-binding PucR family transcriptional regulator